MAIATVDSGEEVKSRDHNSIVGLLNGTANDGDIEYAQPVKLYRFDNDSTYSLTVGNQDTTNGLIAAFQYGPVGAATTVARITKAGIIGNIYRNGGPVFELEAFAASGTAIRGASPSEDPDAAWLAAFQAVAAAGGGTILLGPYTYLGYSVADPDLGWADNCTIRGAGMYATTIKRRASSSTPSIYFLKNTGSGVCDLTVDDNYSQNTTAVSSAISIDGPNCFAYRVYVKNFNLDGINCTGYDTIVQDCVIEGLAPSSYASALPSANYQSRYGISTASVVGFPVARVKIIGNKVTGTRSAAISIGGPQAIIVGNSTKNCHRGDYPTATTGGNIALTIASTVSSNDTLPSQCVIACNTVDSSNAVVGSGGAGGIEIDSSNQCIVANNTIYDVAMFGISVNASGGNTRDILIIGNTITSVNTVTGVPTSPTNGSCGIIVNGSSGSYSNIGTVIQNNTITACENAIFTVGVVSTYSFFGNVLTSNTRGWTKSDSATDWQSWGNVHVSGSHAPLPNKVYQSNATAFADGTLAFVSEMVQANSSGHGLRLEVASTSGGQFILSAFNGNGIAFNVYADGTVRMAGPANGQRSDIQTMSELVQITSGLTPIDTSMQIPAGAIVKFVTARVTAVAATTASYSIGVSGATSRYGTGIADTLNNTSSSPPTDNVFTYTAATSIRITPNATATDSLGRVRITVHYETATAATS